MALQSAPTPEAEPPACGPGVPMRLSVKLSRSWPEGALHEEDARPARFVRRGVEARRTTARTGEGEPDQTWVVVGVDLRVHDLNTDIEVRYRVPDRARTDCPVLEVGVATRQTGGVVERHRVDAREVAARGIRPRAEHRGGRRVV